MSHRTKYKSLATYAAHVTSPALHVRPWTDRHWYAQATQDDDDGRANQLWHDLQRDDPERELNF